MSYLWVDDRRKPEGKFDSLLTDWAKDYEGAVERLSEHLKNPYDVISLDYELGDIAMVDGEIIEHTGMDVLMWIVEHDAWPTVEIVIHSMSPRAYLMADVVDNCGPYKHPCEVQPAKGF
jgi:hypothetical protein